MRGPVAVSRQPLAFEAVVAEHQSRVRRQLRRLTRGDDALADELAQDTFVQAWAAWPSFRGEARPSTWLHRLAYNRFLMHLRSARAGPQTVSLSSTDGPDAACRDVPSWPEAPLGSALEGHAALEVPAAVGSPALRIDLQRALDALPEPERLAIEHCGVLEFTHEEAAAVLGLPLGTLKSQVARAKQRLREALSAWQPESGS